MPFSLNFLLFAFSSEKRKVKNEKEKRIKKKEDTDTFSLRFAQAAALVEMQVYGSHFESLSAVDLIHSFDPLSMPSMTPSFANVGAAPGLGMSMPGHAIDHLFQF